MSTLSKTATKPFDLPCLVRGELRGKRIGGREKAVHPGVGVGARGRALMLLGWWGWIQTRSVQLLSPSF